MKGNLLPSFLIVHDRDLQSKSWYPQTPVKDGIIIIIGVNQQIAIIILDLVRVNNFSLLNGMKIIHHLKYKNLTLVHDRD